MFDHNICILVAYSNGNVAYVNTAEDYEEEWLEESRLDVVP